MDLTDEQAAHLGRAIRAYRTKTLRISQLEAAKRAQLSIATIGRIERGESQSVTDDTIAGVEEALDWQEGSAELVALGGDPIPKDHPRAVIQEFRDSTGTIRHRVSVDHETGEPLPVEALAGQIAASGTEEIRILTRLLSIEAPRRAYVIAILDRILDLVDSV